MKKALLILLTIVSLSTPLIINTSVQAVDVINPVCLDENGNELRGARRPAICDQNQTSTSPDNNPLFGPEGVLTKIINLLSLIVGIAAVVSIIISAIRLIMSGGEPTAISSARRGILFAVIGLAIAATAQLLVRFILGRLPG